MDDDGSDLTAASRNRERASYFRRSEAARTAGNRPAEPKKTRGNQAWMSQRPIPPTRKQ